MTQKTVDYDEHQLLIELEKIIVNSVNQCSICGIFSDHLLREEDISTLTAQEIIDKIQSHLAQNGGSDINDLVFLRYLAAYPVSMCKRDVSELLRVIIGFHYRFSFPENSLILKDQENIEKISYEDLAEIFGRSKATISDCINKTEGLWQDWQRHLERSKGVDEEAKKQLIDDQKQRIKTENGETKE